MPEPTVSERMTEMAKRAERYLNSSRANQWLERNFSKGGSSYSVVPDSADKPIRMTGELLREKLQEAHPGALEAAGKALEKLAPKESHARALPSSPPSVSVGPSYVADYAVRNIPSKGPAPVIELPQEEPLSPVEASAQSRQAATDTIRDTHAYSDLELQRAKLRQLAIDSAKRQALTQGN